MADLDIAEIPFEDGSVRFRYARRMADDGTRWIREGLFQAYHRNGLLASEGSYVDGREEGLWRDYHTNGQVAAEGTYVSGKEGSDWRHWDTDGSPERPTS